MASQNKQTIGRVQKEVLEANIGKDVKIVFFNGQEIDGIILDFDRYSILVRTTEKKNTIIYKHAVMYIEEATV